LTDDEVLDACVQRALLWQYPNGALITPDQQRFLLQQWLDISMTKSKAFSPLLMASYPALNLATHDIDVPAVSNAPLSTKATTAAQPLAPEPASNAKTSPWNE
jgi:hypothetical protein